MINNELFEYVRQQIASGISESEIIKALKDNGWTDLDVKEAISTSKQNPNIPISPSRQEEKQIDPTVESMGFFKKLSSVIVRPSSFFSEIKNETGYMKPFIYLVLITVISLLIQFTSQLIGGSLLLLFLLIPLAVLIPLSIFMLAIISFIEAGVFHLIGKLFKISGTFNNTYKAVAYGLTPYILIQSFGKMPFYDYINPIQVSFLGIDLNIFLIWSTILIALGISKQQNVSFKRALLPILTTITLIVIISLVFILSSGFLIKSLVLNSKTELSPEKISYNEICSDASEFMTPVCAQAVAIYNNDASICEYIDSTPSNDPDSHKQDFKQSCKDIIKTGTLHNKEFWISGNTYLAETDEVVFENKCKLTCGDNDSRFLSYDSDGGKPWGKHSVNGYSYFDSEKEDNSVLIQTCSCF